MTKTGTLNHTEWECKYHVVFIPKYRRKTIYGQLRRDLGDVFRYSNGAYYEEEPPATEGAKPTFEVVAPPVGATVTELPKDAKAKTVGGTEYYEYSGTYYQVFHSGSKVVYMVVKDPTA